MDVIVTPLKPTNPDAWNDLCLKCSNLIQSTYYDSVQTFYNQTPVYFEVWSDKKLVAGVKLFEYRTKKLKFVLEGISKSITQFAECITIDENNSDYINLLSEKVFAYIKSQNFVEFTIAGLYGNEKLLLNIHHTGETNKEFGVAIIDLLLTEDQLLKNINRNSRRNITKATEANLTFVKEDNFQKLEEVLHGIYSQQNNLSGMPNMRYIKHVHKCLSPHGLIDIHFVKEGETYLATSVFYKFGHGVYSVFGGAIKNNVGAGHLIYWNLIKEYKNAGYNYFTWGQVAKVVDESNKKFTEGISGFKRGYGPMEKDSFKRKMILSPVKHKLWNAVQKIYSLKK